MKKRKIFTFFVLFISFIFVIFKEIYYAITYFYNVSLGRTNKFPMMKLVNLNKETSTMLENLKKEKYNIKNWLNNTVVVGLKLYSFDKTLLFAEWFVNQNSDKWVIIVHGYGTNGRIMYYAGRKFYEKGFNVLIPDLRGHGLSGGQYIGMGLHDSIDIKFWINKIIKINKNAKINLYGVSMGASTILMTASQSLPKNVKCVISDCAFTSAYDVYKHQLGKVSFLPSKPLIFILDFLSKLKNNYSIKQASPINNIKHCKIPILFIHGSADDFVPTKMVFKLYKNTRCLKKLLIIDNAGHGTCAMTNENIYWKGIFKFISPFN